MKKRKNGFVKRFFDTLPLFLTVKKAAADTLSPLQLSKT